MWILAFYHAHDYQGWKIEAKRRDECISKIYLIQSETPLNHFSTLVALIPPHTHTRYRLCS